jgi:hypothetical protein
MLLKIFTDAPPFANIPPTFLFESVVRQGTRLPRPHQRIVIQRGLNDALWDLIQLCWSQEPHRRPTVANVVSRLCFARPLQNTTGNSGGAQTPIIVVPESVEARDHTPVESAVERPLASASSAESFPERDSTLQPSQNWKKLKSLKSLVVSRSSKLTAP